MPWSPLSAVSWLKRLGHEVAVFQQTASIL